MTYKLVDLDSKKNQTGKEWNKVDKLNGKIGDLNEDVLLSLPISIQRMTKSVDAIIYARLKKQKMVTIPDVVEKLQIPETTARRALKRLEKSRNIKSRYEMRKVEDGVFHKHHVFYVQNLG